MSDLNPAKLQVTFSDGVGKQELSLPRKYTLTHSDRTGDLFLTIGPEYDRQQISGFYTRLMRDEILAELRMEQQGLCLHIFCHVSGGLVFGTAGWRNNILGHHMPMVIQALRTGDSTLFSTYPEAGRARVLVHFQSNQVRYNRIEDWGLLHDY